VPEARALAPASGAGRDGAEAFPLRRRSSRVTVALLAAAAMWGGLAWLSADPDPRQRYQQLVSQGDAAEAWEGLEAAAARRPDDAALQAFLFEAALSVNRREAAVQAAGRLAGLASDTARRAHWLAQRGALRSRLGAHAEALEDLERALELDPASATALRWRAEAAWRAGDPDEARRQLADLAERGDPEAWLALAQAELARDDAGAALDALEKYRLRAPLTEAVLLLNGRLLSAAGRREGLASLCREARRQGPAASGPVRPGAPPPAWSPVAEAHLLLWENLPGEARRALESLLASRPGDEELLWAAAEAAGRQEDARGALSFAQELLDRAPDEPDRLLLVARAARAAGELVLAETAYLRLLDSRPDAEDVAAEYAIFLAAAGRKDAAAAWMRWDDPPGPAPSGAPSGAAPSAPAAARPGAGAPPESAGEAAPLASRARARNLARRAWNADRHGEALALWEDLLRSDPGDWGVAADLAQAYLHLGDRPRAAALARNRPWPGRLSPEDREQWLALALALDHRELEARLLSASVPPGGSRGGAAPGEARVPAPPSPRPRPVRPPLPSREEVSSLLRRETADGPAAGDPGGGVPEEALREVWREITAGLGIPEGREGPLPSPGGTPAAPGLAAAPAPAPPSVGPLALPPAPPTRLGGLALLGPEERPAAPGRR